MPTVTINLGGKDFVFKDAAAAIAALSKAADDSLCFALDLADAPALIELQDAVKAACGDLPVRWNSPDSFHVTLAFASGIDEETAAHLVDVAKVIPVPALELALAEAGVFETPDGYAIHYRLADDPALKTYQAELYAALTAEGVTLSEYSKPDDFKPHVTMGYAESAPPADLPAASVALAPAGVLVWHGQGNQIYHSAAATEVAADSDPAPVPAEKARRGVIEGVIAALRSIGLLPKEEVTGLGKLLTEGGIKSLGKGYFIGAFTNNFRDREGEIITGKAIDGMIDRIHAGLIPYPELWYKHLPYTKHGKTFFIARAGNIAYCVGRYDDTPLGALMEKLYKSKPGAWAMSHGFEFPTWAFDEDTKEYAEINTFEISALPPELAANLITPFKTIEAIKMGLTKEQLAQLAKETSPEIAAVIAEQHKGFEKLSETVKEVLGTSYKDFTKANGGKKETPAEEEEEAKADVTAIGALVGDMIEAQAETMELVLALVDHQKRQDGRLADVLTALGIDAAAASEAEATEIAEAAADEESADEESEKAKKARAALARKNAGANTPFGEVSILSGMFDS